MSYLSQRIILVVIWKLFPFLLGVLFTVIYYKGYIIFNLPFDFSNLW